MSAPTLSIVLPTIRGREHWLERTAASYARLTDVDYELLVEHDHPGCGPAWQAGGERARGRYLFMAADDLEPACHGWERAAMAACDRGVLPAPRIYHSDGSLQSCGESWERSELDGQATGFTRAPFMSREQWDAIEPMLDAHYFTDNWVSWRGRQEGYPTVVTYGFDLTHHLAVEGRDDGRLAADHDVFVAAKAGWRVAA